MIRVVVVLPEDHPAPNLIAAQLADAIACSIATARGIRAGLSLITRERPHIAILEQQFAFVEGRPIHSLIALISPETAIVFVQDEGRAADSTAAGQPR